MGIFIKENHYGLVEVRIMECLNSVNVELIPTDENIKLLRLILSFASECLDFDIDEIDEFKVALTEIVNYLKPYISIDEPFRFSLYHENGMLETEIIARIYKNTFEIDETSPMFIVARSLLDELAFNNKEDGTFLVRMVKQKRGNDDRE